MTHATPPRGFVVRALAGIVFAGLVLRLAWWAYADPVPVSDFEYYRRLAERMLDDGYFGFSRPTAFRTPGYPLVLAALMLPSRSIVWLSFANAAMAAGLPLVAYFLGVRLTGRVRVALMASALVAINPTFVMFSPILASEPIGWSLVSGAIICLFAEPNGPPPTRRAAGLAGFLLGAAILTRPDSLFYVPVLLAVTWKWREAVASLKRVAVVLAVAGVVVVPWLIRNHLAVGPGAGLSTLGGQNFYFGHNPVGYGWQPAAGTPLAGLNEVDRSRKAFEMGLEHIRTAGWRRLVADAATGTRWLFDPTDNYAEMWSTRAAGATPDAYLPGPHGASLRFTGVVTCFNLALFACGFASLVLIRTYPARVWLVLHGTVVMVWVGYGLVFSAIGRYRFGADVALCVAAAIVIDASLTAVAGRRATGSRSG